MRISRIVTFLIIVLLVSGCSRLATPNSISVVLASPTIIVSPTSTPQPVITPTSELPLRTDGPYFSYFRKVEGVYQFVMMDADGGGRKIISLPKEIENDQLTNSAGLRNVSPDGKWLAFYTGSAGNISDLNTGAKLDLALNLLDLETGSKLMVAHLLSKDYPNNFVEAAKQLNDKNKTPESLMMAFLNGITHAVGWSPDGRYLAFAGQMDGLSSDLYVYDTIQHTVQRLTDGSEELQWVSWSPDGKWILHGSVYWVGEGMNFDIYAAALNGSSVRYISTAALYRGVEHWLNNDMYFEYDAQNGPGAYGLRLVNITTGEKIKIWDGMFRSFEFDHTGKWIALMAWGPDQSPYLQPDSNFISGPYLIDVNTLKKTKIDIPNHSAFDYKITSFSFGKQAFVFIPYNPSSSSYFMSENDELTSQYLGSPTISVSPDYKYWAAVTNQDIKIFSTGNILVNDIAFHFQSTQIPDLTWRPDGSGLFLICESNVYSVNVLDSKIQPVENNLAGKFMWINKQ